MITFAFLLVAFVFYFVGMALPAAIFMVLGMISEMMFWLRLFRRDGNKPGL
jgi:hypothetical protein